MSETQTSNRSVALSPGVTKSSNGSVAIVVACFYREIADRLIAGAIEEFGQAGYTSIEVYEVPGSFELPLAAKYVAESGQYAGLVGLGVVIRGETDHYDYVCTEASRGLMDVQLQTKIPVGFGLLTVDTIEQAYARSGGGKRNSGAAAAAAALAVLQVRAQLKDQR